MTVSTPELSAGKVRGVTLIEKPTVVESVGNKPKTSEKDQAKGKGGF